MSEERHIQLELPFDDIAMESGEKPVKAMSSVARKKNRCACQYTNEGKTSQDSGNI